MEEKKFIAAKELREKIDAVERLVLDYGSHDNAKIGALWNLPYVLNPMHTDLPKDVGDDVINYLKTLLRTYKEEFINL